MRRFFAAAFLCSLFACGGESPPAGGGGTPAADAGGGSAASPTPPPAPAPTPPADPKEAAFARAEKLMASRNPDERTEAILLMEQAEDPVRSGPLLLKLLSDPDADVRVTAAGSIVAHPFPGAAPALRNLLKTEKEPLVRRQILHGLHAIDPTAAVEEIVRTLKEDESDAVRATAAQLLGKAKSSTAVPALVEVLENEFDEAILVNALAALRELKAREAVDPVIEMLGRQSVRIRAEAAMTLGQLGDEKAVDPLVDLLKPEEQLVVLMPATEALAKLAGKDKQWQIVHESDEAHVAGVIQAWKDWRDSEK